MGILDKLCIDATDILDLNTDDGVRDAAYALIEAIAEGRPTTTEYVLLRRRVEAKADQLIELAQQGPSQEDLFDRHVDLQVKAAKEEALV